MSKEYQITFTVHLDEISLSIDDKIRLEEKPAVTLKIDDDQEIILPLSALTAAVGELNNLWKNYYKPED